MVNDKQRVVRMPVLITGMTCAHGTKPHPVRGKYVYSFDGTPWRCWDCLRSQLRQINDFRRRQMADENQPQRQPTDIQ